MNCQNLWSDKDAADFVSSYAAIGVSEDLALRTYTSRLLGSDPNLVLHGGGNTSVKTQVKGLFEETIPVLCVKGSGWDLSTIEPQGHPAVRLKPLQELIKLSELSDEDMVSIQRSNLINPTSPNPSVEALLHAFLPQKFVDHTHSLALLAIADQENSEKICRDIYGACVAIVPYVMPGFQLAIAASKAYKEAEVEALKAGVNLEGMILLKHGIFSFGSTAQESYERMINLVQKAEHRLDNYKPVHFVPDKISLKSFSSSRVFPFLRGALGRAAINKSCPRRWLFELRTNPLTLELVNDERLVDWSSRGVATPDHVIRTKSRPLVLKKPPEVKDKDHFDFDDAFNDWKDSVEKALSKYIDEYENYFQRQNKRFSGQKKQLDPLPRLIAIPGIGLIGVGNSSKAASIAADIGEAWASTVIAAEALGRFSPVQEQDIFDLEYWSLEQAKLGKAQEAPLARHIVLVTGGGSGIGAATSVAFAKKGAEIVVLDKDGKAAGLTAEKCGRNSFAIECDVTDPVQVDQAFNAIAERFGGLDIVISNAGSAWTGEMSNIPEPILRRSFELNLFAHQHIAQASCKLFHIQDHACHDASQYLGGQLLFNISKQALNPGKGFGAYGIAKAALLALMKQYSLEEGPKKIRCNAINADRIRTGLLDKAMIEKRSKARGISEAEYMGGNLLGEEVRTSDVANAFIALALMERTTGALLTVDGGNVSAMVR